MTKTSLGVKKSWTRFQCRMINNDESTGTVRYCRWILLFKNQWTIHRYYGGLQPYRYLLAWMRRGRRASSCYYWAMVGGWQNLYHQLSWRHYCAGQVRTLTAAGRLGTNPNSDDEATEERLLSSWGNSAKVATKMHVRSVTVPRCDDRKPFTFLAELHQKKRSEPRHLSLVTLVH